MPTYDYLCDACEHQFELFQSITAKPERKCPECGRMKLRRLIGPGAAIVFKGSGFYKTDYRSDSYKKAASSEGPAASSTTGATPSGGNGKAEGKKKPSGEKAQPKSSGGSEGK